MNKISAYILVFLGVLAGVVSCTTMPEEDLAPVIENTDTNLSLETRAIPATIMSNMQMHLFYSDPPAGANDNMFKRTLPVTDRTGYTLKASVETGKWNLALVSGAAGTISRPKTGVQAASLPMYEYKPVVQSGKSTDAEEIFATYVTLPEIIADQKHLLNDVKIARNLTKVRLVIKRATGSYSTSTTNNWIKLHDVPSTISYTGTLLPSRDNPATVAVESKLALSLDSQLGYYVSEEVEFLIPAHRGVDFLDSNPQDITTHKMSVEVNLKNTNGSTFNSKVELPIVAKCNTILVANITIDGGITCETEVLPWDVVNIDIPVGEAYSNWIYVKPGTASASGTSWRDALSTINEAVAMANELKAQNIPVYGILVAGGPSRIYNEGFILPEGVKIYGGWTGTYGTELPAGDPTAPYKSSFRNLKDYKVYVKNPSGSINITSDNSGLDGFVFSEFNGVASVNLTRSSSFINAVEFSNNTVSGGALLNMSDGVATNVLYAGNIRPMTIGGGKFINGTVTRNATTALAGTISNAEIYNTIFWNNGVLQFNGINTIKSCAFEEGLVIPNSSEIIRINADNGAWFTTTNEIPGPAFNLGQATGEPYEALSNKSPMLGRGIKQYFDDNTPHIPTGSKPDINGKARHINSTDMGCYEDDRLLGFSLNWDVDRVYISNRAGYTSDVPLLLPGNTSDVIDPIIGINWWIEDIVVEQVNGQNIYTFQGPYSGGGTGVHVGTLKLNPEVDNDLDSNVARECGSFKICTNLHDAGYIPNVVIPVYQTPGKSQVWEQGYVGSFHKWDEDITSVGRYVSGPNSGDWTVRIISGHEWISIDGNNRDDFGGVVQPIAKGTVTGTGNIMFRVGVKTKNLINGLENPNPRYGLIVIERSEGIALFFVRQGEQDDYLYGPSEARYEMDSDGTTILQTLNRNNAKKFPAYNLRIPTSFMTDAQVKANGDGGFDLPADYSKEYGFTEYPTMIGDYFQWNRTRAFRRGVQKQKLPAVHPKGPMTLDPCPEGYRHGTLDEWVESCYQHVVPAYHQKLEPTDPRSTANFVYGRYADGYFDKLGDPNPAIAVDYKIDPVTGIYAAKGILMVNHFTMGSLFFPITEWMFYGDPTLFDHSPTYRGFANYNMSTQLLYAPPSTSAKDYTYHSTHWKTAHVGISCTHTYSPNAYTTAQETQGSTSSAQATSGYTHAVPVRCIKK